MADVTRRGFIGGLAALIGGAAAAKVAEKVAKAERLAPEILSDSVPFEGAHGEKIEPSRALVQAFEEIDFSEAAPTTIRDQVLEGMAEQAAEEMERAFATGYPSWQTLDSQTSPVVVPYDSGPYVGAVPSHVQAKRNFHETQAPIIAANRAERDGPVFVADDGQDIGEVPGGGFTHEQTKERWELARAQRLARWKTGAV